MLCVCVFVWGGGWNFVCVLGGFKKSVRSRGGRKIWGQAGSLCRDPGTLVKRNKNQLCHYTKTEPVWLAVIPLLWCRAPGWALIERVGLLTFCPWKERGVGGGSLRVDLRYSHTHTQPYTDDLYFSQKEKAIFFSRPVFFLGVSSVIADIIRVFAIRASCFYISRENLGEASQACNESTLISGTSFFSQ